MKKTKELVRRTPCLVYVGAANVGVVVHVALWRVKRSTVRAEYCGYQYCVERIGRDGGSAVVSRRAAELLGVTT